MQLDNKGFEMPSPSSLEQRMDDFSSDMREMRSSMAKIADAITRLAVLDEKSHINGINIEKIANKLERIEERVTEAEIRHVKFEAESEAGGKFKQFMLATFGGSLVIAAVEAIKFFGGR